MSTAPLRDAVAANPDFADEPFLIVPDTAPVFAHTDMAQAADPGAEIIGFCSP